MELSQFFTRNPAIAGLEVSDRKLRYLQLEKKRKIVRESFLQKKNGIKQVFKKKIEYETIVSLVLEEDLPEGVVNGGEIMDPVVFKKAISGLLKKIKNHSPYVILTIQPNKVFTHCYEFPSTLSGEKIADTMRLTTEFQSPVKPADHYFDWQKAGSDNSVVLAAAPKDLVSKYIKSLSEVGVHVVATEHTPLSLARAVKRSTESELYLMLQQDSFSLAVVKNSILNFVRVVPYSFCDKKSIADEVKRVINFYESDKHERVARLFVIGDFEEKTAKTLPLEVSPLVFELSGKGSDAADGRFLAVLGAAERGVMPRAEDKLVSLMPVRTDVAYETEKAIAFSGFVSTLIIGISLLVGGIYFGLWALTISLQKSVSSRIATLNSIALPMGGVELEERAAFFNALVAEGSAAVSGIPRWSLVIGELRSKSSSGIKITGVSMPAAGGTFTITGVATDRTELKNFKKSLEGSSLFSGVDLPISNISQKNDLPFSLTLRLRDPSTINFH